MTSLSGWTVTITSEPTFTPGAGYDDVVVAPGSPGSPPLLYCPERVVGWRC